MPPRKSNNKIPKRVITISQDVDSSDDEQQRPTTPPVRVAEPTPVFKQPEIVAPPPTPIIQPQPTPVVSPIDVEMMLKMHSEGLKSEIASLRNEMSNYQRQRSNYTERVNSLHQKLLLKF